MRPPISAWLVGTDAILVAGLAIAVLLGWMAWRQRPTPAARYVWLGALSLLATIVLRVPVAALAAVRNLEPQLWIGPFDRLLGVTVLIMLGWTLTAGDRKWRAFLIAGFAATAITYLSWAQTWAQELIAQPNLTTDPTGLSQFWDAWQIVLAVAVGGALVRTSPRVPPWLLAAIAALAFGSMMELLNPSSVFPLWSRIGTLAAGAVFVAAAVSQTMELGFRQAPAVEEVPIPVSTGELDDEDGLPTPETVARHALFETAGRLMAAPVLFCFVDDAGGMEVWGIVEQGRAPRRLGKLPLAAHPTIGRALGSGGLRLRSSHIAKDIDQLYGLMGLSGGGPVLMHPVNTANGVALLLAGRPAGKWRESDQRQLAAIARRAARSLEALTDAVPTNEVVRVYDAIENQTMRLERIVVGLADRLEELERAALPDAPGVVTGDSAAADHFVELDEAHAAEVELPDLGVEFDARVIRYEMALEALPWGVMVADAGGGVVFANASVARHLHVNALAPGQPVTEIFPDAARIAGALERCQALADRMAADDAAGVTESETSSGKPTAVEVLFESPSVQVELEPLFDPGFGYLGAVAVIRPRVHEFPGIGTEVMTALAEALKSPMTSILGYSDLLSRGVGLNQDQLDRYLQRIDANLARMQVNLENLLTMLDAGAERISLQPVRTDAEAAMKAAVERARPQLQEKSLSTTVTVADGTPPLSADGEALELVLDNLMANAIQRSPQGGDVALTVEAAEDAAGNLVVLLGAADRGQSVVPKGAGALDFDEASPDNVSLSVVRLLVEHMGGRGWAEARGGQTKFKVRFPVARGAGDSPESTVAPAGSDAEAGAGGQLGTEGEPHSGS